MKVSIISLGCPKNLIDSEVATGVLVGAGHDLVLEPEEADAVIINTCGFIEPAQRESMAVIEEIIDCKKRGLISALVVIGCLVQMFKKELEAGLPEVDAFLPISDYSGLPAVLESVQLGKSRGKVKLRGGEARSSLTDMGRVLLTRPHSSYLRIAEGCNHRCSYCVIPTIRGKLKSKPLKTAIEEAEGLASIGVKEINLVAEDTTDYGKDLAGKPLLPDLLRGLRKIKGVRWIRILYAYPTRLTKSLVDVMSSTPEIVEYIDMPIQHISERILKSMFRGVGPQKVKNAVNLLRERIPGIAIRTSVIVGYPGETEEEFLELYNFLETVQFERLGVFTFSPQEGTPASVMPDMVPEQTKAERLDKIMTLQKSIIADRNKSLVGCDVEVIVDAPGSDSPAVGRTRSDAPDIDCIVKIESKRMLKSGTILNARITGFDGYDLNARPSSEMEDIRKNEWRK